MSNYGFVKVAAASPKLKVGDCDFNTTEILKQIDAADKQKVSAIVFPETSITGYTVGDLFHQHLLLNDTLASLETIRKASENVSMIIIIGLPLEVDSRLYNVGVVLCNGKILGIVPKTFLPNYNEFYDKRWFSPACELNQDEIEICGQRVPIGTNIIFQTKDFNFAIEICEDLWTTIPPSGIHALNGAEIIFNLSASSEAAQKHVYRKSLIKHQSTICIAGYVYSAAGNGESTTDLVFSGSCMIAENGIILEETERFSFDSQLCVADIDIQSLRHERLLNKSFSVTEYRGMVHTNYKRVWIDLDRDFELSRKIDPTPFVPSADNLDEHCSDTLSIQVGGLAKRLLHTNINKLVIGVSGGLDSTLALMVTVRACDKLGISRSNIYGITMPGFGTTGRTYTNAVELMKSLEITVLEIPIKDSVIQHFKDIGHDIAIHDVTYENSQARERTQILMDYANKINGLVIGTGNMSELALGWCTYNGDHMSMYAVNVGASKTQVKALLEWITKDESDATVCKILHDVINTPISPELLPGTEDGQILQKTEDVVGPYVLHDFFLYNMVHNGFEPAKIYFLAKQAFKGEYDPAELLKWLKVFYRRFFSQQFKRSCMPDGPKVGTISLSPRGNWRMPSDACGTIWFKQLDALQ